MEIACIPPEKAVSWLGLAPDVRPAGKEGRGPLDYDKLLTLTGELGYRLMMSGAEIYRVEESVRYLLGAYGVDTGEVFAIPNCLIVSLRASGQRPLTVVRRIPGHGTDIYRMEALNDLCRRLCQEVPDLDEAWVRLDRVLADRTQFSTAGQLFGYALGAAAFCLFFGGTLRDALCGGLRSIGWNVPDSHGSMFVWAPLPTGYTDSMAFCLELIDKAGVICTPGFSFGPSGEGYVRFALTLPVERIREAVASIAVSGMIR